MRTLVGTFLACAALAGLVAGPASGMSSPSTKTCAAVATPTGLSGRVTATRVSCRTARVVARRYASNGKAPGWKCTSKGYHGGATVTCKRTVATNVQKVRFGVAD